MSEPAFYESIYLQLHQDVRIDVEKGLCQSGWAHYQEFGRAEGRRTTRLDPNSHSIRDYSKLVRDLIADHPGELDLAMAKAIGARTLAIYQETGNKHFHVLKQLGLQDGHAIYDLACGSGRTASALRRNGWQGQYRGADIIPELVQYAEQTNPGFSFYVHPDFSIFAGDATQDFIYSWSLFTHLQLEEIFLYARDSYRALKPGGVFVFSFLTLQDRMHRELFQSRAMAVENGVVNGHLDMFLDQETITMIMVKMLKFKLVGYTAAADMTATPLGSFGQALAKFTK
jgi:SAM-dependent methyltransferase